MEPLQSLQKLVVGVSFDIPGVGFKNPSTGAIEGFEPDVVRAVAALESSALPPLEFVQAVDQQRIHDLQQGTVDVVVSQLTITPDREELVDFTIPYWITREAILVRKGSGIKCFEDLKGQRIAVTEGSISIRRMTASLPSLPGATLVPTPLSAGNFEAVIRGDADVASNDMINLTSMLSAAADREAYEIIDIGHHFDPKPFGMAVAKGRTDLLEPLNAGIQKLQESSEIQRLLDSAFAGTKASPA